MLAGWVLSIYQLVVVCIGVLIGKVCDIYGRKRVFLACTFIFILGSLLCALAPNIQLLIVFRVIQGLGGEAMIPTVMGIIVTLFPHSRQKAISLGMGIIVAGGIIGPNVGALLLTSFGWRSFFWFNVPIALLAWIPTFFLLKTDRGVKTNIDFRGITYITGMIFAIMIALSQIGSVKDTGWWIVILLLAIGSLFLRLFIRHESQNKDPVVDRELLRYLHPIMTLLLQYMPNISLGFEIALIAIALVVLITVPVI